MPAQPRKPPPPEPQPQRVRTSLDLIKWTANYFQKKGLASPRLEAELLLAEVLNCPRIRLYVDFEKPVPAAKLAQYRKYVTRRAEAREPLQYILGYTQFLDLRLKVAPAVLIPRPETEILALWAVARLKESAPPPVLPDQQAPAPPGAEPAAKRNAESENLRVLDLCTGSGCLALYLAANCSSAQVFATDISADALAVAEENARTLQLAQRVVFRQGDLFGALRPEEQGNFALVVANPPYIDPAAAATLPPEVGAHEPQEALFAPEGGRAVLRRILAEVGAWLRPGGWLGLELGLGQAEEVLQLARASGVFQSVEIAEDGAKLPRFLHARKLG